MTGLIWYRYWLELRQRLWILAAIALWIGASTPNWARSSRIAPELLGTGLAQSIGQESLLDWIAFSAQMSLFAWAAAFSLMGTGLRSPWIKRDGSAYYTLTLPVSRQRLIWTNQASAWIAAVCAAALTLLAQCAVLLVLGRGIPLVPLAASAAVGALFLIAWITALSALSSVMHELWALLASLPAYIASMRWVTSTATAFPAYGEVPWISVAVLLSIIALSLAFSLSQSRIQEF
ncbi:MAG: hypothetical protein ACRD4E_17785 [Bryobacteraceae bacterium]